MESFNIKQAIRFFLICLVVVAAVTILMCAISCQGAMLSTWLIILALIGASAFVLLKK